MFMTFLFAACLLAITPGPGIAYVVARTLAAGRREGLASCLGTGLGGLFHVAAAALGLSALLSQSATVFSLVKYLGAAYLIYLGLRILLSKAPQTAFKEDEKDGAKPSVQGAKKAFFEGVVVEALNVKTALFFLAFLPQFVDPQQALAPQLVLLGCICVALNTLVDVVAVFGADRLLQSSAKHAAWLSKASGLTMLGLGAYLALSKRI